VKCYTNWAQDTSHYSLYFWSS